MHFTLLTVAAALPYLNPAAASPTDRLADFTKIGLTRLGSLTTDGAVDVTRLKSSLSYTAKYVLFRLLSRSLVPSASDGLCGMQQDSSWLLRV